MYIIKEIRVQGIARLPVNIETDSIESVRRQYAQTYNVSISKIKFVYEER